MGCGTSSVDSRSNSPSLTALTSFEASNQYLFSLEESFDSKKGRSSYLPKILEFNLQSFTLKGIQPPKGLQLFLGSSYLAIGPDSIYITGGFNPETNEYINKFFEYKPVSNTFEELPPLSHTRAYHCSTFVNNKLYVFGGKSKTDSQISAKDNIINLCDVYDPATKQWTALPSMKKARAFAYCCIYRSSIYILGGMGQKDDKTKRIYSIEKYSLIRNTWTFHKAKLPYGILASSLVPHPTENSLVILGGSYEGKLHWNLEFDLESGDLMCREPLRIARSKCIGGKSHDKIYVFGGDELNSVEIFNAQKREWDVQVNKLGYSKKTQDTEFNYAAANQPLALSNQKPSSLPLFKSETAPHDDIAFVFGDSNNPFLLEVDLKNNKTTPRPIPFPLVLYNNQPGLKIKGKNPPEYFLIGGIQNTNKPVKRAFIYQPFANKAKRIANLNIKRELASVIQKGNNIYAIGGKNFDQGEDNVLASVERTNLAGDKWSLVASLNVQRYDAISFLVNNQIYVAGGSANQPWTYEGKTSKNYIVDLIERYDEEKNIWEVLNFKVQINVEAALVLQASANEIIVLGGSKCNEKGEEEGVDEIKKYTFKDNELTETSLGKISQPRRNVMGFAYSQGYFLLAGGEEGYCEIFDKSWKSTSQDFAKKVFEETELLNKGNENYYQLVL